MHVCTKEWFSHLCGIPFSLSQGLSSVITVISSLVPVLKIGFKILDFNDFVIFRAITPTIILAVDMNL